MSRKGLSRPVGLVAFSCIVSLIALCAESVRANQVGLELSLLLDVSGSVDTNEFNLQRQGYVSAFQSAAVQNAIMNGQEGSIAVSLYYWSGATQQQQAVGWTVIDSVASANAFAAAVAGAGRPFSGTTAPGSAINFAVSGTNNIFINGIDSLRQVIDLSGDGAQNDGVTTSVARDAALAAGVDAINGLTIGTEANLEAWYNANVKGGAGSFVLHADSFDDFGAAIQRKIIAEVTNTDPNALPLPAAVWAGMALFAGIGFRRGSRSSAC